MNTCGFRLTGSVTALLFALSALLLTGCARSQPIAWYQLDAAASQKTAGAMAAHRMSIGLGPLVLPEVVNRQQIVTRSGTSRLELADRHRWAEPLQDNIARVIRENLAVLLGTEQVIAYPWSRDTGVDYQIAIEIVRFEGEGLAQARLEALWSVLNREGKAVVPQRRSRLEVPAATADHEGLVVALNKALYRLSLEMAAELARMPAPRS